jgi:glyoxylase-like metal-dependent hydrolase (beta-lactamase superfamily II)
MLTLAFPRAHAAAARYQAGDRRRRFRPGGARPRRRGGAVALDTHGHTPGHVSYRFDGDHGQTLLV